MGPFGQCHWSNVSFLDWKKTLIWVCQMAILIGKPSTPSIMTPNLFFCYLVGVKANLEILIAALKTVIFLFWLSKMAKLVWQTLTPSWAEQDVFSFSCQCYQHDRVNTFPFYEQANLNRSRQKEKRFQLFCCQQLYQFDKSCHAPKHGFKFDQLWHKIVGSANLTGKVDNFKVAVSRSKKDFDLLLLYQTAGLASKAATPHVELQITTCFCW